MQSWRITQWSNQVPTTREQLEWCAENEVSSMEREQMTIRLPADLKEKIQREAEDKGISLNTYILFLIDKGRRFERE